MCKKFLWTLWIGFQNIGRGIKPYCNDRKSIENVTKFIEKLDETKQEQVVTSILKRKASSDADGGLKNKISEFRIAN